MYCATCGSAPPFAGYSNRSANRSVSSATSAPSTGTSRPASIVSTTSLIRSSATGETGGAAPPGAKSAPELSRTLGGRFFGRLLDEPREPLEVKLLRRDPQLVAGRLRQDHVRAQQLPKLGDEVLQRGRRGPGRLLAPERVHDPVGRDDPVHVEQKQGEKGALLLSAELQRLAFVGHLERPENPKFEHVTFVAPSEAGGYAPLAGRWCAMTERVGLGPSGGPWLPTRTSSSAAHGVARFRPSHSSSQQQSSAQAIRRRCPCTALTRTTAAIPRRRARTSPPSKPRSRSKATGRTASPGS